MERLTDRGTDRQADKHMDRQRPTLQCTVFIVTINFATQQIKLHKVNEILFS